ncbi:MAG: hypothetical protein EOO38_05305 [Cytophagaceae bacterium]|nr:MAG: hypothetical protein EOO38_05305 [Cytophagaceae bacterium]
MVKHTRDCKVCTGPLKNTRSRPVDVCTKCKHVAWKARQEAKGVDVSSMLAARRKIGTKVFYDQTGRQIIITNEQYQEMLAKCGGLCQLCGNPETNYDIRGGVKKLCIDHCHRTGVIRGLLCGRCNRATAVRLLADKKWRERPIFSGGSRLQKTRRDAHRRRRRIALRAQV